MAKETTSMTPYELRLRMIEMSKDFLERQYDLNRQLIMDQWFQAIEFAKEAKAAMPVLPTMGAMPTLDDITKMATEMNNFVSGFAKPATKPVAK